MERETMIITSQCLDLSCVNEVAPATRPEREEGTRDFGPASHFSTLACGLFFFFFFPCLSFALSGLIASVCNSGSKLIFESTLSLFSPRYRGSLH